MAATYVKPGELGLNPEKLTEMLTELEQTVEIHSISVRFDGKVILEGAWEPFSLEKPQMLHSLSKIGTSICLGFALDEGKMMKHWKTLQFMICLPCRQVPKNAAIMYGFRSLQETGRQTG